MLIYTKIRTKNYEFFWKNGIPSLQSHLISLLQVQSTNITGITGTKSFMSFSLLYRLIF